MDIGLEAMLAQYWDDINALGESVDTYPFAHWLSYSMEYAAMSADEWAVHCIESRGM